MPASTGESLTRPLSTRTTGAIPSPWFSVDAGGYVPRITWRNPATGADEDLDGPEAFTTYKEGTP